MHADAGWPPRAGRPAPIRPRCAMIEVIFDGVDTDTIRPDPAAALTLPCGT
jgi:hypothetical protein